MQFRGFSSLVLILALIIGAMLPVAAGAEESAAAPDPAALAAARDLIEVTGVGKQMDAMIQSVSQGFARGAKADESEKGRKAAAEFDAYMKKFAAYKTDMLNDFALLYAQTFTAAEMKEVADFYRGGTGAKFIATMPTLMQKGSEIGIKYSQKMMQDMAGGAAADEKSDDNPDEKK